MKDVSCLFLITTVLNLMPGFLALRDVQIILPRYVRRGLDVQFSCKYDLEGEALYAVKWYKGNQEFYRYLPKEVPPSKAFQIPGISVDLKLSNDTDVFLRAVTLESGSSYRVVVAAEFPFQTLSASSDMTVVVIGDDAPLVELDRSQYHPGDPVLAECRSPASYPESVITFFINEVQVGHDRIIKTDVRKDKDDPLAKSARSMISFDLPEKPSPVRIKCRATVFTAYDQYSNVTMIFPIPRQLTGTETLLRPGSSAASTKSLHEIFFVGGIFFIWIFLNK